MKIYRISTWHRCRKCDGIVWIEEDEIECKISKCSKCGFQHTIETIKEELDREAAYYEKLDLMRKYPTVI